MLDRLHQKLYHTAKWERYRHRQLFREPLCRMCKANDELTPADTVDHIIPHAGDYKLFFDPSNHQSLCRSCHSRKTHYETVRTKYLPPYLIPASQDITILFGPPASGKTTWAKNQDDVGRIVDLDEIKKVIAGGNPYEMHKKYMSTVLSIRNKIIETHPGRLMIVTTLPNIKVRRGWIKQLNAQPVLMSTPMTECIARSNADPMRKDKRKQKALIERWFKEYQPTGLEDYITGDTEWNRR